MTAIDTLFSIEFGQTLENYLFSSVNRDAEIQVITETLGLRSYNQLAQIFLGYDTPSTALIFELLRVLNSSDLTHRFLNLKSVNIHVAQRETSPSISEGIGEPSVARPVTGGNGEDGSCMLPDRLLDAIESGKDSAAASFWDDFDVSDFDDLLNSWDQ